MLQILRGYFTTIVYVQIWKEQIKITSSIDQTALIEPAVIAVEKSLSNAKKLMYVGEKALARSNIEDLELVYPFKKNKHLINDFDAAETLLTNLLSKTYSSRLFLKPSPQIIIHPMDINEIEVSQVEYRALLELALGSGARDAAVYTGSELLIEDIDFNKIKTLYQSKIPRYI